MSGYKRLRNWFWFIWLGYVPIVFAFMVLIRTLFGTFIPSFVLALAWMTLFLVVGIRLSSWHCPRCGKWFSGAWWYSKGFFARKCVHCGLPKFATSDQGGVAS
jgi:hypothetical protein